MKRFVSILLILVTAFYVLPVSNDCMAETETAGTYEDTNPDDCKDTKKDNGKEFITGVFFTTPSKNCGNPQPVLSLFNVLPVHFTVETPPPDAA